MAPFCSVGLTNMGDEIDHARKRIAAAYDPELFRAMGCRLIGLLTDQVWKAEQSRGPVLPWHDPEENVREARAL